MGQTQKVGKHATRVYAPWDNAVAVKYHATNIVVFDPDVIRLDSGGWFSATTKARMNQASNQFSLGYNVFQKKHAWYVSFNGETTPFVDGITLTRYRPEYAVGIPMD